MSTLVYQNWWGQAIATSYSSLYPFKGQRVKVLIVGGKCPSTQTSFGDKSPYFVLMPTPGLTHILDHQLGCQKKTNPPTILTLLLLPSQWQYW